MKQFAVVKTLLPLLRLYRWAIPAIITLGVLSSLAEGIGISLFIPFLHSLDKTSYNLSTGHWLVDSLSQLFQNVPPDHRLLIISICIFGSVLLRTSLAYSNDVLFNWLDARISHRIRSRIFEQLLAVGYRFLERSQSGRLLNVVSNESWNTSEALSVLVKMIITTCTLAVYITLLLLISWKLTLVVAASMLLISLIVKLFTRRVERLGKIETRTNASLAIRMLEGVEGMKVIRAFGRESYEQGRFDQISDRVSKVLMKIKIIAGAVQPVYEILGVALLVSILFVTLQNPENLPAFLVFIFVLYRLQPKVMALDGARVELNSLAAAVEEVRSLLDHTNKPYILSGKIPFQRLRQGINLDRVTFRYNPSEEPALQDVSIRIPANKTTALVGPSGAGKSTLISLLLRLYDVTEGEIYIDDHPLRALDLASWRNRIALVTQDVYIFNSTVRSNIAYGRLDATEDEILASAKQADAHEFISQLPQGYDTRVGDRGVRLSGGQRQRISLARAIVRNPEILVLDEATNAVDSISEHLIQDALDTLRENRTLIVIAHRLSTIEQADHIIVLEEGRVREQGDTPHLLKLDGLFARLYNLQYRRALIHQSQL